jgi:hypothetical protein
MFEKLFNRVAIVAVLAGLIFTGPSSVEAKTRFHIWFGTPGFYDPGFSYWDYPYYHDHYSFYNPYYYHDDYYYDYRPIYRRYFYRPYYRHGRSYISCSNGRRLVDRSGYNSVRAIDCSPRHYHFRARKNGVWFNIQLDSWSGHMKRTRRR